MIEIGVDALAVALARLLLVVAFRGLPFVVYVALRPRSTALPRVAVVVAYAILVAVLREQHRDVLLWSAGGVLYYAAVACLVRWLSAGTTALRGLDAGLLFACLLTLFLALPAMLLGSIAAGTFLTLGWELTLKTYSYVAERGAVRTDLRGSLFFFMVDPSVVFVLRARRLDEPRLELRHAGRVAVGMLSVLLGFFVLEPLTGAVARWGAPTMVAQFIAWIPAYGGILLLMAYSKHSGVASIQIGLMRLCGYDVRERYRYPLLASSPAAFWNRWNIYVADWAKRYLFIPIGLQLTRRAARAKRSGATAPSSLAARASAISITFIAMGVWHDVYTWLEQGRLGWKSTLFFAANALLLLLWAAAERRFTAHDRDAARALVSRAAFAATFACLIGLTS